MENAGRGISVRDPRSKTQAGIVTFDEEGRAEVNTNSKRVYHSSSEDEQQQSEPVKKKKPKKDTTSENHKTMIRERFLKKQKLAQDEEGPAPAPKTASTTKADSSQKGKYYEGSSDEEEEEDEVEPQESLGKSAKEVMGTFKTFSSVWQDSDEEEEEKAEKKVKKKSVKPKTDQETKTEGSAPRVPQESFDITRYDPTVEDQDQFLRPVPAEENPGQEEGKTKSNKFFEIKTDLKQAFDSKKSSSGFSFGFMGAAATDDKSSTSTIALEAADDIYESDDDIKAPVKKKSNISTFGIQLKGKGVSKSSVSFFFSSEDDPRYEEGVSYFFDHKVDSEELRQKHTENRPVLSDILKKRFRNKQKKSGVGKHGNKKGPTFNGKKGRKFHRKT